jgi:HD-GYP domain-containing protein (c-di-GMP phosphodiesterase class II)
MATTYPTAAHQIRVSEVLGALSYALDLTEGQRPGHAVRTCAIGMRLADRIGLPAADRAPLFHALLMKDLGCSSNAARFAALFGADDHGLKCDVKTIDWPRAMESFRFVAAHVAPGRAWPRRVWRALAVLVAGRDGQREIVRTRCERGAEIARQLEFSNDTIRAIRAVDEHWDGGGQPYSLERQEIPLLGRLVGLAETVEVFLSSYGAQAAFDMAVERRGRWFDPALVDALIGLRADGAFWHELMKGDELKLLAAWVPPDSVAVATDDYLDRVAEGFARVIDAKSPWTYCHSTGVADISAAVARSMGYGDSEIRTLRRAALLHDLGKLGVSNLILDKPGELTAQEQAIVRQHPEHTRQILMRVSGFRPLAELASSHHERLDGTGYHRGLDSRGLSRQSRILCTADICDALLATRPYRPGLPPERVVQIMRRQVGSGIDPDCFDALCSVLVGEAGERRNEAPAVEFVRALAEDYHQAA